MLARVCKRHMTQIQEAGEEEQLILKTITHRFYTTNISHYIP